MNCTQELDCDFGMHRAALMFFRLNCAVHPVEEVGGFAYATFFSCFVMLSVPCHSSKTNAAQRLANVNFSIQYEIRILPFNVKSAYFPSIQH